MFRFKTFVCEPGRVVSWVKQAALVVGMLALASRADQVTTAVNFGPWQAGGGGEFTETPDASLIGQIAAGDYSPFTMNQVAGRSFNFQTFCLERNEFITPNTTFDVTLNNVTVFTGDPLTAGVAYLYRQFATGVLTDINGNSYNYTDTPAGGRTSGFQSADMLQNAIWYLMNPAMMGGQANNPFVLKADQALGGAANAFLPDNGAHHVSVMNLWTPGQPHDAQHSWQDGIVLDPVPEPSVLALLSAAGLLAFRRKK